MKKHVLEELKSVGLSGAEAEKQFKDVTDAIVRVLKRGDRVRLPGVGTLAIATRAATRRRNPQNGEMIVLGERRMVSLRKPEKY